MIEYIVCRLLLGKKKPVWFKRAIKYCYEIFRFFRIGFKAASHNMYRCLHKETGTSAPFSQRRINLQWRFICFYCLYRLGMWLKTLLIECGIGEVSLQRIRII